MSKATQYVHQALASTGFVVVDSTVAWMLRPDLWTSGMDCAQDFVQIYSKVTNSIANVARMTIRLSGPDRSALVLARSTDRLAERMGLILGHTVELLESEQVAATRAAPEAPRAYHPAPDIRAGVSYSVATAEDPRTCDSCDNLTATQACSAAARGKLDFVSGSYRPHIHALRRCIGYQPKLDLRDDRNGHDLWPEIVALISSETTGNTEGDTVSDGLEMTRDVRICDFLAGILKDGSRGAAEIIATAEGAGFSERMLQRAAERLGVVKSKSSFLGGWLWALPNTELTA